MMTSKKMKCRNDRLTPMGSAFFCLHSFLGCNIIRSVHIKISMIKGESKIMEVYRFRSIEALLCEYQELENKTIYFASPDQLNDPMEGYRDIVWRGDKIVWTNFFKNYVFCLPCKLPWASNHSEV